jgi:hypothetical protein
MNIIIPKEDSVTKIITGFAVTVQNLILFTSADLIVHLYSDNNVVESKLLVLTGNNYTDWSKGSGDQYVIDYVASALGFAFPTQPTV